MERIESASLELLHQANTCITRFFERIPGQLARGTDEELHALLQLHEVLESVGALLGGRLPGAVEEDLRLAVACYRENLTRLRWELAAMQESANARRVGLDARQEHLRSAKAWCVAARAIS